MRRIAVFARYPSPGEVKRRLSPALAGSDACALYRAMLEDTLATAAAAGEERFVYWADAPADRPRPWVPEGLVTRDQTGTDLGERLAGAFADMLTAPGDRAIVIGADCPELAPETIGEAFEALGACDLVLAPASDGGYVLIGLRRRAPTLFEGITWGTDRVLEQTIERARLAGLETSLLGGLSDLDTPDDLVRFLARHAATRTATAQRTQAALRELGLLPPPA